LKRRLPTPAGAAASQSPPFGGLCVFRSSSPRWARRACSRDPRPNPHEFEPAVART
jgi:hypothetical protein